MVICLSALLYRILLISSGRIPLEKSHLSQEVREEILFDSLQDDV